MLHHFKVVAKILEVENEVEQEHQEIRYIILILLSTGI